jgi:hypothetical protein
MWTVVYIAPNRIAAEQMKSILEIEGIMVMLRPIGAPHLGDSASVELLVTQLEAAEAAEIIAGSFNR